MEEPGMSEQVAVQEPTTQASQPANTADIPKGPAPQSVTMGRLVRFQDYDGFEKAAIVCHVNGGDNVNLSVFETWGGVRGQTSVPFSAEKASGTWHWPARG